MEHPVTCPSCGTQGHRVDPATPTAMLEVAARAPLAATPLRFCATGACDVVYYGDGNPALFYTGDLAVPVFQKSTDPARLVCYCFEHSVASVEREVATTGTSGVPDAITQKCKAGLDDCKRNNPQGRCCLVNVRKVLHAAQARRGAAAELDAAQSQGCCASRETSPLRLDRSDASPCCASTTSLESE